MFWKQQVQTDRTIPNNKPGIIIHDNKQGTCMLIDVAIPGDRIVIKKEAEKILVHTQMQHSLGNGNIQWLYWAMPDFNGSPNTGYPD